MSEGQHPDFQLLLRELGRVSMGLLAEAQSFAPHGAAIEQEGAVKTLHPHVGEGERSPEKFVARLEHMFREARGRKQYRATGYAVLVKMKDKRTQQDTEAILVSLERDSGDALDVYLPYRREPELSFDRAIAARRAARVFTQPAA